MPKAIAAGPGLPLEAPSVMIRIFGISFGMHFERQKEIISYEVLSANSIRKTFLVGAEIQNTAIQGALRGEMQGSLCV